jgi:phosphoribulokinase
VNPDMMQWMATCLRLCDCHMYEGFHIACFICDNAKVAVACCLMVAVNVVGNLVWYVDVKLKYS